MLYIRADPVRNLKLFRNYSMACDIFIRNTDVLADETTCNAIVTKPADSSSCKSVVGRMGDELSCMVVDGIDIGEPSKTPYLDEEGQLMLSGTNNFDTTDEFNDNFDAGDELNEGGGDEGNTVGSIFITSFIIVIKN
ncbi:hypothetical protein L6452_02355 [Arctium lappa]|uniref:Uncharacterized protein n=1 Tax=Arctium lappa TaxID=4217 RepID=A0ACB9FK31_ARCLA|nr:hypothetical protein L6452_02355 [Arctium lappa]